MMGLLILKYLLLWASIMIKPEPIYLVPLIEQKAEKYKLSRELVLAVIETESEGFIYASRYEPNFYEQYLQGRPLYGPNKLPGDNPKDVIIEEEFYTRASSLGLMQVMLQTAREMGYQGYAHDFFKPEVNLEYGCKYLASRIKLKRGNIRLGLLAYNGGGDVKYPDRVFRNLEKVKALNFFRAK